MNFSDFTSQIANDLDAAFRLIPPEKALDCIDPAESRIAVGLTAAIINTIKRMDARATPIEYNKFILDNRAFEVFVGYKDVSQPATVAVLITELGMTVESKGILVPIRGQGKYHEAYISVSPQFQKYSETIAELTQAYYERGYSWLTQFLLWKVRELETSITIELYAALRLAFGERRSLADRCLLVLIDDKDGNYIFDLHCAEQTIKTIASQRGPIQRPTTEMFLGLLNSFLPFEKMFSRHAIASGEKLQIDLSKAEYTDKTLFALAERVLFKSSADNSKAATVFPLSRQDSPYLVVVFPTSRESEILPVLKRHTNELIDAFKTQQNRARTLRTAPSIIPKSSLSFGQVAEAIGGFTKGLLGL